MWFCLTSLIFSFTLFHKSLNNQAKTALFFSTKLVITVTLLGDATVPGLGVSSNNIIPLITNLQASLKANVQSPQSSPAPQPRPESFQDSQSVQIKPIEEPEISVPKYPSLSSVEKTLQQNSNEQDSTKTANPVATGANSNKTKTSTDNDNISKVKHL